MSNKKLAGFTLIELMIVVAIVGILAMIALPGYQDYVRRTNRSAAQSFLMNVASRQEQFLLQSRSYASSVSALGLSVPSDVAANYTVSVTAFNASAPVAYTLTAVPLSTSIQYQDGATAAERNLVLNSDGSRSPSSKWN